MFPPDRRARGMSFVLFGSVSGALWGPVVFGPLFAHRGVDAQALAAPWLIGIPFMLAGFVVASLVRPDPKEIAASYPAERDDTVRRRAAARDPAPAGRVAGARRRRRELRR